LGNSFPDRRKISDTGEAVRGLPWMDFSSDLPPLESAGIS
jgi:hypothetical protein